MWYFLVVAVVFTALYWFGNKRNLYWKNKGVTQVKPLPFFGNFGSLITGKKSLASILEDIYYSYPNKRYVGFYLFSTPTLMVRDLDLIKTITVKEFDTFPNRPLFVESSIDPLWNRSLIGIQDPQKWQELRAKLSPSFSSGKLKLMLDMLKVCSQNFTRHFEGQNRPIIIDMKDALSKYATDVIATTAFGVTCNSFEHPHNEFHMMSKEASNFRGIKSLRFLINFFSSKLAKYMKVAIIPLKAAKFFSDIVNNSIRMREENGAVRPDMIHLLMQARKGQADINDPLEFNVGFAEVKESINPPKNKTMEITNLDITANAVVYMLGSVESTSSFMYFTCYELAVHSNVQEQLRKEVKQAYDKCEGAISYSALLEMEYMDMVLSEVLRRWPSLPVLLRNSIKPFTIKTEDGNPLTLEAASTVLIPSYVLQRDPKYFPDPEKFDPGRFSEENKRNFNSSAYMPFGSGRRNCIGSRLALLMAKLLIAEILMKFEILPTEETQIPAVIEGGNALLTIKGGCWLQLKSISSI